MSEEDVLRYIQRHGPVAPAALVERFPQDRRAMREHMRALVDKRQVGLNWQGKFEAVSS